jgi:hypothetical protein
MLIMSRTSTVSLLSQQVRALSALLALCGLAACVEQPTNPSPGRLMPPTPSASGGISGGGGGLSGGGGTPAPAPAPGTVTGTWMGGYPTASTDLVTLKLNQATDGTITAVWIETPLVNPNNVDQKLLGSGSYTAPLPSRIMSVRDGAAAEPFTATVSADGKTLTGFLAYNYQVVLTRQ